MISLNEKRSRVGVGVVIATIGMSVPIRLVVGVGRRSSASSLALDGVVKPSKIVRKMIAQPARMILLRFERVDIIGIFYSKIDVRGVTRSEETVW
jgi:hypothetical protein